MPHRAMASPTRNNITDAPSETTTPLSTSLTNVLALSKARRRAVVRGSQNKDAIQQPGLGITRAQVAKPSVTGLTGLPLAVPGPSISGRHVVQAKNSFPSISSSVSTLAPFQFANDAPVERKLDESICTASHPFPTFDSQEMMNATDMNELTGLKDALPRRLTRKSLTMETDERSPDKRRKT